MTTRFFSAIARCAAQWRARHKHSLLALWFRSARSLCSLPLFFILWHDILWQLAPVVFGTLGALTVAAGVWYAYPPFAALLVTLPLPSVAILCGFLYVPPVIRACAPNAVPTSFVLGFLQSVIFFFLYRGGLEAALYLWQHAVGLLWVLLPVALVLGIISAVLMPFLFLALIIPPHAHQPYPKVLSFALKLSWYEAPAALLTYVLLLPWAFVLYGVPSALSSAGLLTPSALVFLQHSASIIYWQLSWAFFIRVYQRCVARAVRH